MRCNRFAAMRVAMMFVLVFGVTVVSYSGIDSAKLAAALKLKAKLSVREMTLSHTPKEKPSSGTTKGGSSNGTGNSTSGK